MIEPYKKGRYTHLFFSSHGKEHKINMFKLRGALGLLKEEGTGIPPVEKCPYCCGLGKVIITQAGKSWDATCEECNGTGAKVVEKECEHNWEYSSPPHRDQRCKKCGQHRIEPEAKSSGMEEVVITELGLCIDHIDYTKLLNSLRTYLKDKIEGMDKYPPQSDTGPDQDTIDYCEGYNKCLEDVKKVLG